MQIGQYERKYSVYIPASWVEGQELPLVINFHGATNTGAEQSTLSRMNGSAADNAGVIVAYPEGLVMPLPPPISADGSSWNTGLVPFEGVDDVAFTSGMIDQIADEFGVDRKRVHATGYSMGSTMSLYLACHLSNEIASVAGVAGPLSAAQLNSCDPGRPYAIMYFHGTADGIVPFEGSDFGVFPAVSETPAFWATNDHCATDPTVTDLPDTNQSDESTAKLMEYSGCDSGAEVLFYEIDGGGHNWPGGNPHPRYDLGAINKDVNATALILDFFSRHPMPS